MTRHHIKDIFIGVGVIACLVVVTLLYIITWPIAMVNDKAKAFLMMEPI